ncbi:hypothetical protein SAPIO_CDS9013 [Scedosporium apiospermum]|uniref:Uncharacterized protein n=1 Tax=Pseudallescheria apiosperma TaxID=563466 RepID=A0A084FY62_PSEDA|nr:uncharacterized protein SAPIO_CDS9013 [Scedosporium apiospermum]KEZ40024.1 hypothetical protein SAPIO_CDS9013 [Scedosporium apiospermum]
MAQEVPGIDLKHFEIFAEEFFFSSGTAEALTPKIPPGTPLSQAWVAFDLLRGKIMAKVYFMPILKWIQTGIPTRVLVSRAVQKCSGKYGTYDAPMKLLDSYLESFVPGSGPVVEMVAIDCVDSPDSRIKVYLRTDVNTLAKAKVIYTLGGRLSGEAIDAGLEALTELWPILFRLEGSDFENTEVFPRGSYCGCAVEMKAGHAQPGTKIHIPVRKINVTDAQLCQSLSAWFAKRGHRDFAATYEENLRAAFPDHNFNTTNGTHTFVSFAYTKKTGVYMTMYYSTKIFGVQVNKDYWKGYDNLWSVAAGSSIPGRD